MADYQSGISTPGVSFVAFLRSRKVVSADVKTYKNGDGEEFRTIQCVSADGTGTQINFSSNLGEMSAAEVLANAKNLQVVRPDGGKHWILCKQGGEVASESIFLGALLA